MEWLTGPEPEKAGRSAAVDLLRGLALGGMLLVNLGAISGAGYLPFSRLNGLDWVASFLVHLLAMGKFYPLFAFLFGWGIARRQLAASAQGKPFFLTHLRRMLILGLFGLAHAALLWEGDILFFYALVGLAVLLCRRLPGWLLVALALAQLLVSSLWWTPVGKDWMMRYIVLVGVPRGIDTPSVAARLALFLYRLLYAPTWAGNYAALILLGYATGLKRLTLPRPGWLIALLALGLNLFYVWSYALLAPLSPDWRAPLSQLSLSLGGPLLAWVYAGGAARLREAQPLARALAGLGRVPLSIYLGQSLLASLCLRFFWMATPPVWAIYPWAAAIFFVQLAFSIFWLRRFQRGPLEAFWRWLAP